MKIPGYKIQRLLGKGGTSSVYLAVQESLGRRVALKVMKRFNDPRQAERFLHEGRIIASLNHRNIITIHDIGTIGDRHFIAMEYLEGRSLAERIDEGMPVAKVLSLLEQMAACLHFVHRKGIIHRDIKPSNILFHADGTPKLTDFGIAKLIDSDQELTLGGSALGSPYYLSPEQAEGLPLDGRSDIYALGIVFYQMLTAQKPYAKGTPIETIVAHLTQPLPVLPDHYLGYQELLERMIAKRREDRVASAKELVHLIRESKGAPPPRQAGGRLYRAIGASNRGLSSRLQRTTRRLRNSAATYGTAAIVTALLAVAAGTSLLPGTDEDRMAGATPDTPARHAEPLQAEMATASQPTPTAGLAQLPVMPDLITPEMPPSARSDDTTAGHEPLAATGTGTPTRAETDVTPASDTVKDLPSDTPALEQIAQSKPDGDARAIADWMQAAEQALKRYRLTTPAQDNAYSYYQNILALDPGHAGAQSGVKLIGDRYTALARGAMRDDNDRQAQVYAKRGLAVRPHDPELTALRDELEQRQQARAQASEDLAQAVVVVPPADSADNNSVRGRPGTGNIIKDFKSVWRSIFN